MLDTNNIPEYKPPILPSFTGPRCLTTAEFKEALNDAKNPEDFLKVCFTQLSGFGYDVNLADFLHRFGIMQKK